MQLIADILLVAGALGAAIYCFVLGRRLKRFNDLEKGVGGAVAVLSAQVDDLRKTLTAAQSTAAASAETLTGLAARAEAISRKLELQMASLHDIPEPPAQEEVRPPEPAPAPPPPPPDETPVADETKPPNSAAEPMFMRHRKAG
ncbi:hypothetical protein AB1M95_00920 [Sulfitobacter sp. LCG007]